MNRQRKSMFTGRSAKPFANVFSPKVAPDPTMQKQLEDRVKEVLEELHQRKQTPNAAGHGMHIVSGSVRDQGGFVQNGGVR